MYHQFKELADVDITAEPMEVGPTCHYVMGGVEVDAETQAATVSGLFAAGEVSGGMHGSIRAGFGIGAGSSRSSRVSAPSARPSSSGRPGRSPLQNGVLAG